MNKKIFLLAGTILFLGGCVNLSHPNDTGSGSSTLPMKRTLNLNQENKSGLGGSAAVEEVNGKVKVSITIGETSSPVSRPAVILTGNCPNAGTMKYQLNDVVNGKSETILPDNMQTLIALGWTQIVVEKSAKDTKSVIACGDINSN